MIFPEWKTAPFWPLLCNPARPGMFPDFVKDYFYLPNSRDMFCPGYGSDLFSKKKSAFSGTPKFNVLALKVDFPAHFEYFCTVFLRILRLFFWFNCFLFLDVLQAGVWKHKQDLKSKKLKELADSLPAFVLCSRAVSTNVKYKNAWLNWKKWGKR